MRIDNEHLRVAAAFGVTELSAIEFSIEGVENSILFDVSKPGVKVAAHIFTGQENMSHVHALAIYAQAGNGNWIPTITLNLERGWLETRRCHQLTWFMAGLYSLGFCREQMIKCGLFTGHELAEMPLQAKERLEKLQAQERELMKVRAQQRRAYQSVVT